MRIFKNYASLQTALARDPGNRGAFRFKSEYGPAGFVCSTCKTDVSFPLTGCTTGYGIRLDAKGREKMDCFACCAIRDRKDMIETGHATLYLTCPERGTVNMLPQHGTRHELTNWPGTLRIPVYYIRKGRHNWAGRRYDFRFRFEGQDWRGTQYGDNTQIAHCRRLRAISKAIQQGKI